MKVEWTGPAKARLREVFDYHKKVAGVRTAQKVVGEILERSRILATHPRGGAREQLLADQREEYRRLVEGNYKIVYVIEDNLVSIVNIFDCRRDPVQLTEELSGQHPVENCSIKSAT